MMMVSLKSSVHTHTETVENEKKTTVIHEPMKVVVGRQQECVLKEIFVQTRSLLEWKSVQQLIHCYCDIPEKHILAV